MCSVGSSGAVASDCTDCSNMGLAILEQGGNSVDAAVTTMLCVGIVNPDASGIGGGGFMMVHDHKSHAAKVFDFRETAPQSATQNIFYGLRENAEQGGISAAIPGELKGIELAHKTYGKLPWSSVIKPAADLARNGFKVTESLAKSLQLCHPKNFVETNLAIYLTSDNKFAKEGMTIRNVDLADTLDIIGEKDQTLISVPAPASGPALLSIMNILEGYNFKSADRNTTQTVHRILEAFKFGYAQQQSLADPKFEHSVVNSTAKMLSKSEAKLIMNRTTDRAHSDPAFYDDVVVMLTERGTSHVSVIDAQELMVSVTTSVNDIFGSRVMTDTGILLNNQMADFADPENPDTKHSKSNYIEPGKRPQSNMCPLIMYHRDSPCKMRLMLGGTNWTRIVSGVAQVLLNVVSFGLTLADAISAPRVHTQLYPGEVEYEDGFAQKVVEELKLLGHDMVKVKDYISIVQGIKKINNRLHAVSDPRKGATAAMFNSNV